MSVASQGLILLVDDNAVQSRLYGDVLMAEGFTVVATSNAKEAGSFARQRPELDAARHYDARRRWYRSLPALSQADRRARANSVPYGVRHGRYPACRLQGRRRRLRRQYERSRQAGRARQILARPASRSDSQRRRQIKISQIEKRLAPTPAEAAKP